MRMNKEVPYGRFTVKGRKFAAHRIAYQIGHGQEPGALLVCHACDTPLCVRPDHLFLGTHQDNMRDLTEKGRRPRGETHWHTRLTEQQIFELRQRYLDEGISAYALAREYGICKATTHFILAGKTWRWLGLPDIRRTGSKYASRRRRLNG
jgi:hypothetical protein